MEMTRLAPLDAGIEKLPLSSVTVPDLDPLTIIEAPLSGFDSGSVTVPLTFVCADAAEENKRKINAMNA
jgi:hypothetical protein